MSNDKHFNLHSRRISELINESAAIWEAAPYKDIPWRERMRRMWRDKRTPIYAAKHLTRSREKDIPRPTTGYGLQVVTYNGRHYVAPGTLFKNQDTGEAER